jgi:hypothetical protein
VSTDQPPTLIAPDRLLTLEKFHRLAEVPREVDWFADLSNPSMTSR